MSRGVFVDEIAAVSPVLKFRNFSLRCDKSDSKISFNTPWNWELPQGKKIAVITESSFLRYQLITSIAGLIPPMSGEIICDGVLGWPVGGEGGLDGKMRISHGLSFLSVIYDDCLEKSRIKMHEFWDLLSGMNIYPGDIIRELSRTQKDFFFLALSILFSFDCYLIFQANFLMSKDAKALRPLLSRQLEGKALLSTSPSIRFQKEFCTEGLVLGSRGQLLFLGGLLEARQWAEKNFRGSVDSDSEDDSFNENIIFKNEESSSDLFNDDVV